MRSKSSGARESLGGQGLTQPGDNQEQKGSSRKSLITRRIPTVPENELVPITQGGWPGIEIASWAELLRREEEILHRIARVRDGGNLFLIHPFQLLADIGVDLSDRARAEILEHEPHLHALSLTPYSALKQGHAKQQVSVHVHGLFRRTK